MSGGPLVSVGEIHRGIRRGAVGGTVGGLLGGLSGGPSGGPSGSPSWVRFCKFRKIVINYVTL